MKGEINSLVSIIFQMQIIVKYKKHLQIKSVGFTQDQI